MITPRLQKIIDLISTQTIADIGTDHAYIPIRMAQEKRITKAIACDKNTGPIEIARQNVEKSGFSDIIELRQGDGLEPIYKNEVETVIIAGMGGNLIGDIIESNIEKTDNTIFILQPMNAQYELRKRLYEIGFKVIKEELECEGFKIYNIIVVKKEKEEKKFNEIHFHIPEELLNHRLFHMLFEKKKREFTKICNGRKKSDEDYSEIIEKYEFLLKELEKIKEKKKQ